jgi:hypothetical protein
MDRQQLFQALMVQNQESRSRNRASAPESESESIRRLGRNPHVDTRTYWWMVARFTFITLLVVVTLGLAIWAFVLEGQVSDGIGAQGRRVAALERELWEKCTPDARPPTAYKDTGKYILADPTETQFPIGWTSASHRCLPNDPESTGAFGMWIDGTLDIGANRVLDGTPIRPTFSTPSYLTIWEGAPLTILAPDRCAVASSQDNSVYLVLQATFAPYPCLCSLSGFGSGMEMCYHYPDPNHLSPVFLNNNKEIP